MVSNISSYINFLGEEFSTATILSDMITDLQTSIKSSESSLTNVNIGNETLNLFEANCTGIFKLLQENDAIGRKQSARFASGVYLNDRDYEIGLSRKGGIVTNGSIILNISTPLTIDCTRFAGIRILNSKNGLRYLLDNDVVTIDGSTWVMGSYVC